MNVNQGYLYKQQFSHRIVGQMWSHWIALVIFYLLKTFIYGKSIMDSYAYPF